MFAVTTRQVTYNAWKPIFFFFSLIYSGMGLPNDTAIINASLQAFGQTSVEGLISFLGGDPSRIENNYIEIRREIINSAPFYLWFIDLNPTDKKGNEMYDETGYINEMPETENNMTSVDVVDIMSENVNVSESYITTIQGTNDTTTSEPDPLDKTLVNTTDSWEYVWDRDSDEYWDTMGSGDYYNDADNYTGDQEDLLSRPIAKFLKDPKDKWDLVITDFKTIFRDIPQLVISYI